MALFVLAVNKGLCATFRTIFVVVGLVHEQAVYSQLLKGHHIVLAALVVELFQLGLNRLAGTLQLLDAEPLPVVGLQLPETI